ncbi:MAG: YggU family protein [Campylobacterales bacterium]|nr:YggU family protein [Campylobacterales bacterium]HEO98752.1 YggU family protein [Campylobacterota bacterium]
MFYSIEDDQVTLRVKAQPAASKNAFAGEYGEDAIKVTIKAPAVEGAANKELIKFLAKSFKVAKSNIIFKSGEQSKIKVLKFPLTEKFSKWLDENNLKGD